MDNNIKDTFWSRLFKLFRKENDASRTPSSGDNTISNQESKLYSDLFSKRIPIEVQTELLLAPDLDEYIRSRGEDFRRLGFYDGVKGITNEETDAIANSCASTLVQYIKASSNGKLEAFASEMEVKEQILNDEGARYQVSKKHLETKTYYYNNYPRTYSKGLGVFYLIMATCLIFADVPLAYALTVNGFNLTVGSGWNIFLVIGIALCAVYIKIYYDDYIATSLGSYTLQFKNIPGVTDDFSNNQEQNEIEKLNYHRTVKSVKKEYWIKFAIKSIILLLSLCTIWKLGEFRFINLDDGERKGLLKYIEWMTSNGWNITADIYADVINTAISTFRYLTLLFPIIGGVCLSLALTNFQNCHRFKDSQDDYLKLQENYLIALENYNKVKKLHNDFKGIYDEWQGQDNGKRNIAFFTKVFKAYYIIGFKMGFFEPDHHNKFDDLYAQTEIMRRKFTSRRIYNKLANEFVDKLNS